MRNSLTVCLAGFALSGCISSSSSLVPSLPQARTVPQPPVVQQAAQPNVPTLEINAPIKTVRDAIISRAKSRGTTVAAVEPSGVVLERVLQQSPAALESSCGPHKLGRKIRVLLGTADQGAVTMVSEQRFVVDDGAECRIQLTPDVVEDAKRSLTELKTEVESKVARR